MTAGIPWPTLTGPAGALTVWPERGAKITSLTDARGFEWLAPCRPGREAEASFVDAEMGGWDECAPTIDPVTLPDGRLLPDHGSLWHRPWLVVRQADTLVAEVSDPELGFALRRVITATPQGFRFDYEATLLADTGLGGAQELPFLWAAHPQFVAPERVVVPGLTEVVETHPGRGVRHPWTGQPPPAARSGTQAWKAWAVDPEHQGHPGYLGRHDQDSQASPQVTLQAADDRSLTLRWGGAATGCALWFDPAEYADTPVVAIEPATASTDAATGPGVPWLTGAAPLRWWVDLELAGGLVRD